MTCIVGLVQDDIVYMAGDSALTDMTSLQQRSLRHPKVFTTDNMIIGCCSSLRIQQILQYEMLIPDKKERQDDMQYVVVDFVDAVRHALKEKGSLKKDNEIESQDAHFLVGFNNQLYTIEDDHQVYQCPESWAAIGCGSDLALGALYALKDTDMSPNDKLMIALNAAAEYSGGVKAPFYVMTLNLNEEE